MSDDFIFPDTGNQSSGSSIMKWFLPAIFLLATIGAILFTSTMKVTSNPQVDECKLNIRHLGKALMMYVKDHGDNFPEDIKDKSTDRPIWLQDIFMVTPKKQAGDLAMTLKCYSDDSISLTSYIMNKQIAGKPVNSINAEHYPDTIVLYERPTGRYHRWAFYLDGKVKPYKQIKDRNE